MNHWPLQKSQTFELLVFSCLLIAMIAFKLFLKSGHESDIQIANHSQSLTETYTSNNSTLAKDSSIIKKNKAEVKPKYNLIDINLADTSQLIALPGIGSTYANRIIKYRQLLGGFHSKQQLLEVYGMTQERINEFQEYIILKNTSGILRKININKCSFKILLRHPYVSYEQTKAIFNLKKHRMINLAEIKQSEIFDSLSWISLKPYLKVSEYNE